MDKEQKKWIFILIILILILLNVAILINEIKLIAGDTKNESSNEVTTTNETNATKTEIEKHIEKQEENVRVQYYVANFLGFIENQDYEGAYNLLNEDFKKANFDSVEKFKDFCKIYPEKNTVCKYSGFDRIGASVYVITVTIQQLENTNFKTVQQNFVIRENDYNDFKVSLQMDYHYLDSEGNVIQ